MDSPHSGRRGPRGAATPGAPDSPKARPGIGTSASVALARTNGDASGIGKPFGQEAPAHNCASEAPAEQCGERLAWGGLAQAMELMAFRESALLVLDRYLRVLFCNRGALQLFATSAAEIVGQRCHELFRESVPGCVQRLVRALADGPLPNAVELDDCRLRATQGLSDEVPVEGSLSHFRLGGEAGYLLLLHDVSRHHETEARLRYLSQHDPLTGLSNRALFMDRLENAVLRHHRSRTNFALLFIDLDGFKAINDRHGHAFGDALLNGFAERLFACIRASDTAGRLGGDEFAVIFEGVGERLAMQMLDDLLGRLHRYPLALEGCTVQLRASIGVALYPQHGATASGLLRHADQAMYRTKSSGTRGTGPKIELLGASRPTPSP